MRGNGVRSFCVIVLGDAREGNVKVGMIVFGVHDWGFCNSRGSFHEGA